MNNEIISLIEHSPTIIIPTVMYIYFQNYIIGYSSLTSSLWKKTSSYFYNTNNLFFTIKSHFLTFIVTVYLTHLCIVQLWRNVQMNIPDNIIKETSWSFKFGVVCCCCFCRLYKNVDDDDDGKMHTHIHHFWILCIIKRILLLLSLSYELWMNK